MRTLTLDRNGVLQFLIESANEAANAMVLQEQGSLSSTENKE